MASPATRKHLGQWWGVGGGGGGMLVLNEVRGKRRRAAGCSGQPPHPFLVLGILE